jgi:hypothetical protein
LFYCILVILLPSTSGTSQKNRKYLWLLDTQHLHAAKENTCNVL